VVQLQLANGVTMIVEGPAEFEVKSGTAVSLSSGKLMATVPHTVQGFSVRTSSALIADLGTEFGVDAKADQTRVEVFQGRVRASVENGNAEEQILATGQAAQVSPRSITIDPAGANAQHFVRSLAVSTPPLDVVDLMCGGDGTTRRRGIDIDSSGRVGLLPQAGAVKGDRLYHRIANGSVLDGCFIPDGRIGPVQIDSARHLFAFPATSDRSMENICTGGPIPLSGKEAGATLGEYATPQHSVLYMHADRGLTLDLAKIRRLHPAAALANFHCLVGNVLASDTAQAKERLYLIVDGEVRFQKNFSNLDGIFPVEAALRGGDRFLTVAITEDGNGIPELGTMFADASLGTADRSNESINAH
jgi:hypothetical protein